MIKDDNYYVDDKGKVHYLFSKGNHPSKPRIYIFSGTRKSSKRATDTEKGDEEALGSGKRQKKRKKKGYIHIYYFSLFPQLQ